MDVFISYRRDGGESWAPLIKAELRKRGVLAYLDKHNMKNGSFDEALKANIRNAPNFLLILSKDIFQKREGTDWVREEIIYATKQKKNMICVMVNGYDPNIDLSNEVDEIKAISTYDILSYNDSNNNHLKASIDSILNRMVDEKGHPWKKHAQSTSWYSNHSLTSEDTLWMSANYEVSRNLDIGVLKRMLKEDIFKNKTINYMCFNLYDVENIYKRCDPSLAKEAGYKLNVYGFAHKYEEDDVIDAFGEDHFITDVDDSNRLAKIKDLLLLADLPFFDIIECTLSLKDLDSPDVIVRELADYLNPNGGILYFRELDDDYVDAFPDPNGYIKTLIDFLSLDTGAGNRHLGKQMYRNLVRAGASKTFISNGVVSTANLDTKGRKKVLDAYFSYLIPEFRVLTESHPENDEYKAAYEWLVKNYDEVVGMFLSNEFYFRAGFVSGYGVFYLEEYKEEVENIEDY